MPHVSLCCPRSIFPGRSCSPIARCFRDYTGIVGCDLCGPVSGSCGTGDGSAPRVAVEGAYGLRDRAGVWLLDRFVKDRGTFIAREPRLVLYSPAVSFSDCVGIAPDCVMIAVGL